jgi:hypothetical protein
MGGTTGFPSGQGYANEVRLRRAALLRAFRLNEVSVEVLLYDPSLRRMPIQRLLEYTPIRPWTGNGHVPHGAKQFAWQAVAELGCGPWREVGLLTDRQRAVCVSAVCGSLREPPESDTMSAALEPPGRSSTGSHTWSHES